MTLWPSLSDPSLPRFLIQFRDASFTAHTKATWLCRARCPTEAVVSVLNHILYDEEVQPTAAVRYQVWLATPEQEKGFELTGAIDSRTVEDYLAMHRGAEVSPPKLYTVFLAHPDQRKKTLYWMTLQARTPTEALIICKDSSENFQLGFTDKCLFSIYEGWNTPRAATADRALFQMPSVYMHEVGVPERPKRSRDHTRETTQIYIDWQKCYEEDGAPWADPFEDIAQISGEQEDVAKDVNVKLLSLLRNLDQDWPPEGVWNASVSQQKAT